MIDKRIVFDEGWNRDDNETMLYFTAPKEMLIGGYPEAISMEISLEFPTDCAKAEYVTVSVSPTVYVEDGDYYEDYDWRDIDMPKEEIEELIELARAGGWSEEQEVE